MSRRYWIMAGGAVVLVALGIKLAVNHGAKAGLDEALTHLPPGFTVTHGPLSVNALSGEAELPAITIARDGTPLVSAKTLLVSGISLDHDDSGMPKRAGTVTLRDVTGAGGRWTAARVILTDLSLENLRAVLDPAAYAGGKPAWTDQRPVLGHAELHDVSIDNDMAFQNGKPGHGHLTIEVEEFDGISMAPLAQKPDVSMPAGSFAAALFGASSARDVLIKSADLTITGEGSGHVHLSNLALRSYRSGILDSLALDGLRLTTDQPAGTVSLDRFSIGNLDFSGALAIIPGASNERLRAALPGTLHARSMELHGLLADYPVAPLVRVESITASNAKDPAGGDTGHTAIQALTIKTTDRPLKPATRQSLADFGMQDFRADLVADSDQNAQTGRADLRRFDLVLHDLGSLHVTASFDGFTGSQPQTQAETLAMLGRILLRHATLRWDDDSLLSRLINEAARRQGVTPDQVLAGLALPVASLGIFMPDQQDAAQQVNAFLTNHHSLAITLTPPAPVRLAGLRAQSPRILSELGARITGN